MDIQLLIEKILTQAPSVAILLWLVIKFDKQMAQFYDLCLKHLLADADADVEENSNRE